MPGPAIVLIPKGLALLGAALGLTGKAVVLSAAALKAASIGTVFIVKGVMFTKSGALALTVASGAIAYSATSEATMSTIADLGYTAETNSIIPVVRDEIESSVQSLGTYTIKYCEHEGQKLIVSAAHKFCGHDGSPPKIGHSFEFTDQVSKN
jgi:hypothetical protein